MPLNFQAVSDLLLEPFVEPHWAIEEWLVEGESGLVIGEPKTYKSTLALDMAVSLATGTDFMAMYPVKEKVPVLFIQEENNMSILMPQLYQLMQRAGYGTQALKPVDDGFEKLWVPNKDAPDLPLFLSVRAGWKADKANMGEVVNMANDIGARYVFIDPLYKINPSGFTQPDDVAPVLHTLSTIENETEASVVLVHHANKGNTSGGKRILGSQLIWAWGANNVYIEKKAKSTGQKYLYVQREFRGKPEPDDVHVRFEEDFQWTVEEVSVAQDGKPKGGRASAGYALWLQLLEEDDDFRNSSWSEQAARMKVTEKTIYNWRNKTDE